MYIYITALFPNQIFLVQRYKKLLEQKQFSLEGGGVIQSDALNNDFVNAILEPNLF